MSGYLYCSKLVPVLHFDLIEKDEEGLSIHITCGMDMAERARYPMAELHLLKELYEEQTAEGLGVTQPSTQTLTGEGLGVTQPSTQTLTGERMSKVTRILVGSDVVYDPFEMEYYAVIWLSGEQVRVQVDQISLSCLLHRVFDQEEEPALPSEADQFRERWVDMLQKTGREIKSYRGLIDSEERRKLKRVHRKMEEIDMTGLSAFDGITDLSQAGKLRRYANLLRHKLTKLRPLTMTLGYTPDGATWNNANLTIRAGDPLVLYPILAGLRAGTPVTVGKLTYELRGGSIVITLTEGGQESKFLGSTVALFPPNRAVLFPTEGKWRLCVREGQLYLKASSMQIHVSDDWNVLRSIYALQDGASLTVGPLHMVKHGSLYARYTNPALPQPICFQINLPGGLREFRCKPAASN